MKLTVSRYEIKRRCIKSNPNAPSFLFFITLCRDNRSVLKDGSFVLVLRKLVVDVLKGDGLRVEAAVHLADTVAAHLHICLLYTSRCV